MLTVCETAGVVPPLEAFGAIGFVVVLAAGVPMGLAYPSFSVASLRTCVHSRTVGLLVLAPPVVFGVMLVQAALAAQFELFSSAVMAWSAVVLSGGQALAFLAIGHLLRLEGGPADRAEPGTDVTA